MYHEERELSDQSFTEFLLTANKKNARVEPPLSRQKDEKSFG